MNNPRPAPLNVIPDDPTGYTWGIPEGAIARFGKGAHSRTVNLGDVSLSPCGNYFAAGTGSGLWWYEVSTMSPVSLWETERGLISAVEISVDGKLVVTSNWDGDVKIFDIQNGECLAKMKNKRSNMINIITLSPDNKRIAIPVDKHGKIEIFDTKSGESLLQLDLDVRQEKWDSLTQLTYSPNNEILAATWKIPVDSDGPIISTTRFNPQTYLYHPETGEQIGKYNGGEFTFSPNSRFLAYVCTDDKSRKTKDISCFISVLEIESGERVAYFKGHDKPIASITFSPCGSFLVSSDNGGTLRKWELSTAKEKIVCRYDISSSKNWLQKLIQKIRKKGDSDSVGERICRVEPFYSSEGGLYSAVLPHGTEVIEVWDVESHEKVRTYERLIESIGDEWFTKCPELAIAHALKNREDTTEEQSIMVSLQDATCFPEPIVFSPDGKTLASSGVWNAMILWDVENKQTHTKLVKGGSIYYFTFLDNNNLLIANSYDEYTLQIWELGEPYELIGSISDPGWSRLITFDPTGKRLALCVGPYKEQIPIIWELESDKKIEIDSALKDSICSMSFTSDGRRLAIGSRDGIVQLWEVNAGKQVATVKTPDTIYSLTSSPCGNMIAAGIRKNIYLWDTEELELIRTIKQPTGESDPNSLAFSPCGKYLASGTWWEGGMEKMAIRLWDVGTGENIHSFKGHSTDIQSLTFSPDGTLLASGSYDGTILLWDLKSFLDQ